MSSIVSHYLAKPTGSNRGLKPPSENRLAVLTKPHADLNKLVALKKAIASRIQCNLAPTDAELLLLEAYAPQKAKILGTIQAEKMAKSKFDALGAIIGAANWVQILTEFANNALKETPPDITAAHTALGVISRMNVHGVVDSAFRLQTAAVWERRKEVLEKTSKMPENLKKKVQELLPTGPGPFRGELTKLVENSAKELEQARISRGETDLSRMANKLERILDATHRRPGGKQPTKPYRKDQRKKAATPYRREGQRPFPNKAQQNNQDRAGPHRNRYTGQNQGENSYRPKKWNDKNKSVIDNYQKGSNKGAKPFSKQK
jgi:hypothetical protein